MMPRPECSNQKKKASEEKKPAQISRKKQSDDDLLTQKAIAEINRDTKLFTVKANELGPTAQLKNPNVKMNKRFLSNTINSTLCHNKRNTIKTKELSQIKLKELDRKEKYRRSKRKFGDRKHEYSKPEKLIKQRRTNDPRT